MDFGLSTHLFVGKKLTPAVLDKIADAGFPMIEIFAQRQHFDYMDSVQVGELSGWFQDHPMRVRSLHAPLYQGFHWGKDGSLPISLAYSEKRRRIESTDEIRRAVEAAEKIPFEYLVVHMGLPDESYSLRKFDDVFSSLEHLRVFAGQLGVKILIENIPNELSLPQRLVAFLRYTKVTDVGLCFDTGHAHMTGDVAEALETMQEHIVSTHVHDNDGEKDEHLYPFEGGIDWRPVVPQFHAARGRFPVVFELRDYGEKDPFEKLKKVMENFKTLR